MGTADVPAHNSNSCHVLSPVGSSASSAKVGDLVHIDLHLPVKIWPDYYKLSARVVKLAIKLEQTKRGSVELEECILIEWKGDVGEEILLLERAIDQVDKAAAWPSTEDQSPSYEGN